MDQLGTIRDEQPALRFAVLGSLRVEGPDGEITIASGKQRALLAALISRVGTVVSTDWLTEALWGDEPTPTAAKSLQTYIARVRRAIGVPSGAAGPIVTRPPGYLLDIEPEAIDIHRFERLHDRARQLLESDPSQTAALLDEALSLWRGDAWAEFRDLDFAMADAERLDELRATAQEDRFAAELALGRHESAIGRLEAFAAARPFRERPREQLMVALYRAGRHADALTVFQRFRARLIDELGLEPSDRLRELEAAMLVQSPELDIGATPPSAEPVSSLPAPLRARVSRGSFAGRDDELEQIERAADDAAAEGRAHLLLVVGESGIGKTRLVSEAAVRLLARVPTVCFGRCDEEGLIPYQPITESVATLIHHVGAERRAEIETLLAPVRSNASPAVPTDHDRTGEARRLLLAGFDALIEEVAHPVMMVIDDIHWADRPSLQVVRHVLRAPRHMPVLVAATARPECLAPGSELADLLATIDSDDITLLELRGLSRDHARSIATEDFPSAAPLAGEARARTGGNPFLLRELLRHVVETGATSLDTVPPQLREVVARRVARLEPRLVDVLGAGALIGERFRLGLATRAVGAEPADILDAAEAAVLGGVVEQAGAADEYRFVHALVRDALVQRIGGSRRLHLHLRIAEELEASGDQRLAAEIAHHRHAARPEGDANVAIDAARRAADHATASAAHEQAARMLALATDMLEERGADEPTIVRARFRRAEALIRAGDLESARTELVALIDRTRQRGDGTLLAHLALRLGDTAPQWGEDRNLIDALEDALELLPAAESALRARVTARLAQASYYSTDADRRRELTVEAEDEARRSGDAEALAWVLSASHDALWGPDDVDGRLDAASKIVALGDALDHRELQLRGHGLLVTDLLERGRFAEARAATERHAAVAEELNQPLHLRDVQSWRATWAQIDGRLDDVREAIVAARGLSHEAQDPYGDLIYWIQQFGYAKASGGRDDLDELALACERLAVEFPHVPAWRSALASVHVSRGDRDAVEDIVREQVTDDLARIPRDVVWMNALTYLAEATSYLGDGDRARIVHAALVPYADNIAVVDRALLCKGSVAHWVGLLELAMGEHDAAERSLRAACETHRSLGAVLLERASAAALATLG